MAYPFRPVRVPVVVRESELKEKRRTRKTDLFLETGHSSGDTPARLRKKLHVFSHRQ